MMRLTFCALLTVAACGGAKTHDGPGMKTPPETAGDTSCPLEIPGTSISVEDTATGAALVFVTTGDAAAVRTRANALAQMHNQHDGPSGAMGMMFSQTATATAKDIAGGSRIEMAAKNPDDVAKLQGELRMH